MVDVNDRLEDIAARFEGSEADAGGDVRWLCAVVREYYDALKAIAAGNAGGSIANAVLIAVETEGFADG
jgi:hypothetical protein